MEAGQGIVVAHGGQLIAQPHFAVLILAAPRLPQTLDASRPWQTQPIAGQEGGFEQARAGAHQARPLGQVVNESQVGHPSFTAHAVGQGVQTGEVRGQAADLGGRQPAGMERAHVPAVEEGQESEQVIGEVSDGAEWGGGGLQSGRQRLIEVHGQGAMNFIGQDDGPGGAAGGAQVEGEDQAAIGQHLGRGDGHLPGSFWGVGAPGFAGADGAEAGDELGAGHLASVLGQGAESGTGLGGDYVPGGLDGWRVGKHGEQLLHRLLLSGIGGERQAMSAADSAQPPPGLSFQALGDVHNSLTIRIFAIRN